MSNTIAFGCRKTKNSLFYFSPGQSGSGRLQSGWSCWQKPGTTPPCRGCSRRRTSTHRAWCPTLTPGRPCTCTGAPRRPRQPYRDPWSRGSCFTACREAESRRRHHRLLCPLCLECFPGLLSSGEPGPLLTFYKTDWTRLIKTGQIKLRGGETVRPLWYKTGRK